MRYDPAATHSLFAEVQQMVSCANTPPEALQRATDDLLELEAESLEERTQQRREVLIRRLIAHPNTRPDTLLHLTKMLPNAASALLENPILPLISLEMPGFYEQLPARVAYHLLQLPHLPEAVIAALTEHPFPWIAFEARTHIGLAGEASADIQNAEFVVTLAAGWERTLAVCLKKVADIAPIEERASLWELVEEGIAPSWAAIGEDPENDPVFQERLAEFPKQAITDALQSSYPRTYLNYRRDPNVGNRSSLADQCLGRYIALDQGHLQYLAEHNYSALLRRALRRHPKAERKLERICRFHMFRNALGPSSLFHFDMPALRWFALSRLREADPGRNYTTWRVRPEHLIQEFSPSRLGLALCLDLFVDRDDPTNAILRERLREDANRYVRAAARGEWWRWPNTDTLGFPA